MADFSALKTAIQANIRTNANEEITGAILQEILLSMVTIMGDGAINGLVTALQEEVVARQNAVGGEATARQDADASLSGRINGEATARGEADTQLQNAIYGINTKLAEGYIYAGIATPSTNPSAPTGKVFYIALQGGTYTNFSGLTVTQGISILKYNGSTWSLDQLWGVDDVPTAGSDNLVKSGGVSSHLYNGFINGKGSNQFSNSWIKLLKNRHYKLIFDNPLWEHTSASETLFVVSAINGSTATDIFAVAVTEKISRVYEFVTTSEFDSIRIALKADAGVRVNFVIEDAEPYITIGGVTIFNSNNLTYGAWYNRSDNTYSSDNFDVRSIGFVNVKENTIYKVQNLPSGYKLSVICYTPDGTYISNGSFWFTEVASFTTPSNCGMIHIQFRKTDLTAVDLTSFPNVIVSENSDYFVPVFSRNLSGALSRFTTLKKGQYNEAVNDYPSFQLSTNRATTELIPLGRGRVQISIGEGYDFYFKPYDSYSVIGDKGGPWTSETTVYDLVHSFWVVLVRHHDNSALSDSDIANCGLTITALTPLYQTAATTLGDMSIERKIAALSTNELAISRPKIETWSHYFIRKLTNNNRIVVPSQSLADIHISKMLGAKFMEFNLMFTSDNVPICRHGVTNTKLSGLIDSNGNDVEIDDIREVSLAELKANYRYKSLYPQFQTTITTLEEALQVCNELNITPIVSYDSRAVSLLEQYCGNRWCAYIGSTGIPQRPSGLNKNIPCMVSMWADNPNESVENYLAMADAFGYGSVFAIYLAFLKSLSDSSAASFIQAMKEKGTNICIDEYTYTLASDYADIVKYQKMGAHIYHEYSVIDQDIFDTTKIADDKNNFADVVGTFSQGDGCIELSNGNEINLSISGSSIVSAIKAVVQYSGTINLSLGEYISNVEMTSSDNSIIEISTVLEDLDEELTISSVGASKIFSVSLYAKQLI